jgi:hypothetical protein
MTPERGLIHPDPFTDARCIDPGADCIDHSGTVLMRNHERKRHHHIAARTAALLGVGGVHR